MKPLRQIIFRKSAIIQELTVQQDVLQREVNSLREEVEYLKQQQLKSLLNMRRLLSNDRWIENKNISLGTSVSLKAESFDVYLEKFKALYPHLYDTWATINLSINIEEYRDRPETSCSVEKHLVAPLFGGFIAPYLQRRVLDIGCGPYPVPVYLDGYPTALISGIDPLSPFEEHPFEFVHGFAEFLPWPDETFDTVIAATSLDHVLSLELTLSEIVRVLKQNGKLLIWEALVKGSPRYNPSDMNWKSIDNLHLFHFDEEWFEEFFKQNFKVIERINVNGLSFFYAWEVNK